MTHSGFSEWSDWHRKAISDPGEYFVTLSQLIDAARSAQARKLADGYKRHGMPTAEIHVTQDGERMFLEVRVVSMLRPTK